MNINYILENAELKKLLNDSIEKSYYRYKLFIIIEKDDFIQDCYMTMIKRIGQFDNEKSTLKTYIPLIVMSKAKEEISIANGRCKTANKREFTKKTLSLDYSYEENEDADKSTMIINAITDNIDNVEFKLIINEILHMSNLTEKQKFILFLMSKGYTLSDIAKLLHKPRQTITATFDRAKEKILLKYDI
jgi:RNA polymerase sigma factor (sigma-70 family)